MADFLDIKGLSHRNIKYIWQWNLFYNRETAIGQQLVAQLVQIPWGHNLVSSSASPNHWTKRGSTSRTPLLTAGAAVFSHTRSRAAYGNAKARPSPTLKPSWHLHNPSWLNQILKDPYVFDFLTLSEDFKERELELGPLDHMTRCARAATRPWWNTP